LVTDVAVAIRQHPVKRAFEAAKMMHTFFDRRRMPHFESMI
jgi:hypothetical protein